MAVIGGGDKDDAAPRASPFRQCPKCGQASLARQENCDACMSCGYSKCS
jgi:ribonucleoside-diphosphate reductase alpha chain